MKIKIFFIVSFSVLLCSGSISAEKRYALVKAQVMAVDKERSHFTAKLSVDHIYRDDMDEESFVVSGHSGTPIIGSGFGVDRLLKVNDVGIFVLERSVDAGGWRVSGFSKYGIKPYAIYDGSGKMSDEYKSSLRLAEVNERVFSSGMSDEEIFKRLKKYVYEDNIKLAVWALSEIEALDLDNNALKESFYQQMIRDLLGFDIHLQIAIDQLLCQRGLGEWPKSKSRKSLLLEWVRNFLNYSDVETHELYSWLYRAKQIEYLDCKDIDMLFFEFMHNIRRQKLVEDKSDGSGA